jgi:hypothetical protein
VFHYVPIPVFHHHVVEIFKAWWCNRVEEVLVEVINQDGVVGFFFGDVVLGVLDLFIDVIINPGIIWLCRVVLLCPHVVFFVSEMKSRWLQYEGWHILRLGAGWSRDLLRVAD